MTNSECWVIKLWLVLWAFPSPLRRVLWGFRVFLLNGATPTLIVKVFQAVLFRRPYKWIGKCYWLSHKCVLVNMCEPSCEKSKQCALAFYSTVFTVCVCVSVFFVFFLLCFYLNASSHWHYYIKARIKKKIQQDAGLIPALAVLTVRLSSSLLSPQSHSAICKSSGPQWNRVTTEEKHKVNMANISWTSFIRLDNWILTLLHCSTCSCDTLVAPRGGQRSGSAWEQLVGIHWFAQGYICNVYSPDSKTA